MGVFKKNFSIGEKRGIIVCVRMRVNKRLQTDDEVCGGYQGVEHKGDRYYGNRLFGLSETI